MLKVISILLHASSPWSESMPSKSGAHHQKPTFKKCLQLFQTMIYPSNRDMFKLFHRHQDRLLTQPFERSNRLKNNNLSCWFLVFPRFILGLGKRDETLLLHFWFLFKDVKWKNENTVSGWKFKYTQVAHYGYSKSHYSREEIVAYEHTFHPFNIITLTSYVFVADSSQIPCIQQLRGCQR